MGKAGAVRRGRVARRRGGENALCFAALCVLVAVVAATQGDDYLDIKERQLVTIAEAVLRNDAQKCDLLKTCAAAPCSRNTCLPGTNDVSRYTCMHVSFNKYCNADVPGCDNKSFDYTRSFVRTAITTDFTSTLTTIATCAQRALDVVFQNISTPTTLLRLYFGGVDGSFRAFPGSDQDVNDPECGGVKYDPRVRPWYIYSTSVPKVVVILVDAAQSMNHEILQGQGSGTVLDNVKIIVGELLKSLSLSDFVNIIMFDSSRVTPLSPSMVQVQANLTTSPTDLGALTESLKKQVTEAVPGTSDVARAMGVALESFSTGYANPAKVLVVFTDGQFATGNVTIPAANLTALKVKVFVYKVPPINDDILFINGTPFADQLCNVGGSFEVISKVSGLSNPLLSLNAYFSYTAALHAMGTNNSVDYSPIYAGYEQIEGNITTMSISVFDAGKKLLGVAGMDLFIDSLGSLTDSVQTAILTRSVGKAFNSSNIVLSRANCSMPSALPPPEPCPVSVSTIPNGGFCYRTDQTTSIKDLACCQSCVKARGRGGVPVGVIVGAVVGGVVAVIVPVAVVMLCLHYKQQLRACFGWEEWNPGPGPPSQSAHALVWGSGTPALAPRQ